MRGGAGTALAIALAVAFGVNGCNWRKTTWELGVPGFGIDAARQQMGAVEEEGVGQEQVDVGLLFRVERRIRDAFLFAVGEEQLDGVQVVVVGC